MQKYEIRKGAGPLFQYAVYKRIGSLDYVITVTLTLWGAKRAIKKDRERRQRVVHVETFED